MLESWILVRLMAFTEVFCYYGVMTWTPLFLLLNILKFLSKELLMRIGCSRHFTLCAAHPNPQILRLLWEDMKKMADNHSLPCLVAGEFNEVISSNKKRGSSSVPQRRCAEFNDVISYCGWIDFALSGPAYTSIG